MLHHQAMSPIDDLVAEHERLGEVLAVLPDSAWAAASAAQGWSVADVVLHQAQSEEMVVATIAAGGPDPWPRDNAGIDDAAETMIRAQRTDAFDANVETEMWHTWRTVLSS